jgi:CRISPR/Cas system-associated protein Csm6
MGSATIKWKMKKMTDSRELDVEYKMAVDAVKAFLEREGRQVWATRCVSGGTLSTQERIYRKILQLIESPYTM